MHATPAQTRASQAFEADIQLCPTCGLTYRMYWSGMLAMHAAGMSSLSGRPAGPYAFAPAPEVYTRVPMCRSAQPHCAAMRRVLEICHGPRLGTAIADAFQPLTLH